LNILFIYLYHSNENLDDKEELNDLKQKLLRKKDSLIFSFFEIILKISSDENIQLLPLKKVKKKFLAPFFF